ncbi:MAG: hypothetical protein DRI86_03080 [Bacteroidetes bacterium]|nr:MAG: hypothetical protein DRI86_03080 [Bacteroidota bacterium]
MRKLLIIFSVLALRSVSFGQELNSYWQQEVDYVIRVQLNDSLHSLDANIEFNYINNSPDTLYYLYIHLWPNAYSNDNTALCNQMLRDGDAALYFADSIKQGYISKLNFTSNNQKLKFEYTDESRDIAILRLPKALLPRANINIATPFHVKIPSAEFSRLGHSDQSYQITQWYPKPAVYDKNGWHQMHYVNQGEFYSEYGNFDVFITVPENYRIGATGNLVDAKKEEAWLDSISDATKKISDFSENLDFPKSSSKTKTLHYHQEKVHDFAWFADKRYHVLRGEVVLNNGHKVMTQALFTNEEADLWSKSLLYIGRSTKFYSDTVGNYPYNQVTAVQGALSAGAGMEYPNVTIIGNSGNAYTLEQTIMHEVGHNWFYGIFGFNERDYPWMDEGINTFYQTLYENKYYPNLSMYGGISNIDILRTKQFEHQFEYYFSNKFMAAYNLDQAANLNAEDYSTANYGISIYMKTPMIMQYLHSYYGYEEFSNTMHNFFDKWKYKHPQPEDFSEHFQNTTKEDLSWAFEDLINTKKKIDYKILSVDNSSNDSIRITIKNKGDIKSPTFIRAKNKDGKYTLYAFHKGFNGKKTIAVPKVDYTVLTLNDSPSNLEYNLAGNFYKKDKLFHKARTLKLKFITALPKPDETILYYTPVMGWNNYNKFMLGVLFFNHSIFEKRFEYEIMPLYSFKTHSWNGFSNVNFNFYTKDFIRRISLGIEAKKYTYDVSQFNNNYLKVSPYLDFYFKNPAGVNRIDHRARLRVVNVKMDVVNYFQYCAVGSNAPFQESLEYMVSEFNYLYNNKRIINPYGVKFTAQANKDMWKADIRAHYEITYQKPRRGFYIGAFAGYYHQMESINNRIDYSYKMSSWTGTNDYLYDYTYMGRTERDGLWANQMTPSDGGFYLPSPLGRSRDIMLALNLKSSIPLLNFIKIYGNFGYSFDKLAYAPFLYETGFMFTVLDGGFEVYFPVFISEDYHKQYDLNPDHTYWNTVRFTLRLDLLNPFKQLKRLNL